MRTRLSHTILLLTAGAVFSASCADDTHDEDAVVLDKMQALGFSPDNVEIDGDRIYAEGDIVFERDSLLDDSENPGDLEEETDKGYRYAYKVSNNKINNVKLVWGTGTNAPTQAMKDAFIYGAAQWSGLASSRIRIGTDKTGPTITVKLVPGAQWGNGTNCPADAWACALTPSSTGNPGTTIWLRDELSALTPCTYTTSILRGLAVHELGHAIGFAHPKETGSTHIANTPSCSGTYAECSNNPPYSTVMLRYNNFNWPTCNSGIPTSLQVDDVLSAGYYYPN